MKYFHRSYDLGSGAAKIVSQNKVKLKSWNSIQVKRDRKQGTLMLNNAMVQGQSKGKLNVLNLNGPVSFGGLKEKTEL